MTKRDLQHKETLLIEALLSGLDARESAKAADAGMLLYLAELLVQRVRDELAEIRVRLETAEEDTRNGDAG